MRLSMWILADWLKSYHPIISIKGGEQVLRSARILSPDTRIEPQNMYLISARESDQGNKTICVHGADMLILDSADTDRILNDILNAFDHYNRWSDGLTKDIADGCSLQHLVDRSYDIFREPMAVFDAGHALVAHTAQYGPDDVDDEWKAIVQTGSGSLDALNKAKDQLYPSGRLRTVQELNFSYFNRHGLQKTLFRGKTAIGRIVLLEFHRREGKGAMQLLDMLGSLVELWMNRTREERLQRAECDIFRSLLDGAQVSGKELDYKLSVRGWEKRQEKLLLKLELPAAYKNTAYPLLSKLERSFSDCYVFSHREHIYILANLAYTPWESLERELQQLLDAYTFRCAVSYPFHELSRFSAAAGQCRLTLQAVLEKQGGIYHCRDHALDYIRNIIHTAVDASIVHPALYVLKENDRENQSDLYKTLDVYLRHNCNLAHTAKALHLHRNSLLYRLNKIRGLTDLDLDAEQVREYLRLSYIVLEG